MQDLEDGWDGEGSCGYAPETWERARRFLWDNALSLWTRDGIAAPAPGVMIGPDGSIDIYWDLPHSSLLLNVPDVASEAANYYGTREDGAEIKGSLDTSGCHEWLMKWLAR